MKFQISIIVFAFLTGHCNIIVAQPADYRLQGHVFGYYLEPSGFLKKEKVEMEGSIQGAQVMLYYNEDLLVTAVTGSDGSFSIKIPGGYHYRLVVSKQGYLAETIDLDLNYNPLSTIISFDGIDVLINHNISVKPISEPAGLLRFNQQRLAFEFSPNSKREADAGKNGDNAIELLSRAIVKYNTVIQNIEKEKNNNQSDKKNESVKVKVNQTEKKNEVSTGNQQNYVNEKLSANIQVPEPLILNLQTLNSDEVELGYENIHQAEIELDELKRRAKNRLDSLIIRNRESEIKVAREQLKQAENIIEEREDKLLAVQWRNAVMLVLLLLSFVALAYLIKSNRKQKRLDVALQKSLKETTESIQYARKIQKAILHPETELQNLLKDSFIIDIPRSTVSGDFCWFGERDHHIILAAIDCTGHGVPGAFLTSMVNTLLNQIVVVDGNIHPGEILGLLHTGIFKSLRQDEDETMALAGMDMALISLSKQSGLVHFASAFNPVYVVNKNGVREFKGDLKSVGGRSLRNENDRTREFTTQKIDLLPGDSVYLSTDGFADQFGGLSGGLVKAKKLGGNRLKELLVKNHETSARNKKAEIQSLLKHWQGDIRQTDDILITGFTYSK